MALLGARWLADHDVMTKHITDALLGSTRDGDLLVLGSGERRGRIARFFGSTVNSVLCGGEQMS